MKVVVTGGSGFIGRTIVRHLSGQHEVTVIDVNEPGFAVNFMKQDLRQPFALPEDTEVCVQLASIVGGIQYFTSHAAQNVRDNSLIYSNVFEAARAADVRKVVYASSSVVYQFARTFPTPEDEIARIPPPASTYGFTKLLGEYFCKAYAKDYGIKYTVVRPFNAYGPGEDPDPAYAHVIPHLAKKVLDGQYPVEVYGDGNQTRCFTFVEDIAEAFAMCLDNPRSDNETFNVSSDEEVTIKTLLAKIWKILRGSKPLRVKNLPSFPEDVQKRNPSIRHIKSQLGWSPSTSLNEGLKVTLEWLMERTTALL